MFARPDAKTSLFLKVFDAKNVRDFDLLRQGVLGRAPIIQPPRHRRRMKEWFMPRILWWLAVGLVAGWLTGKTMDREEEEALTDVVVGMAGALGWWA